MVDRPHRGVAGLHGRPHRAHVDDGLSAGRLIFAVAVAVVVLAGLATLVGEPGRSVPDPALVKAPELPRADALQRPAPPAAGPRPGHPAMAGRGWRVVSVNSVSGVLMVTVETDRLDEMAAIAREVVTPAAEQLLEALVYFHRPGTSDAVGRVQWTPDGGYLPLRFGE